MIIKKSLEHLKENKMTYCQHFMFAAIHGLRCIKAGILLICHSIVPAVFVRTGSNLINKLNNSFIDHNEYLLWLKSKDKNNDV